MGAAGDDTRSPAPVMTDVARLAGVSHQTVSRVLNDHPNVSAQTRVRVERAIAQLGYRRNVSARALVTRSTRTIGVVGVDTTEYGPSRTLFAVERAARSAGYFVNFATLPRVDRHHMAEAVDHLLEAGVDGLVVIAPVRSAHDALAGLSTGVPLVEVAVADLSEDGGVVVDQERGAQVATRHLLGLGHETVTHVAGPAGWLDAEARRNGWRRVLEDDDRPVPPVLTGNWTARSGYAAGAQLASAIGRREVTAVFVANDQMALGVLRALHDAGLRVPQDASVVGFDDIPEAEFLQPALTTLRQDFAEVGRRSIATLLARIAGLALPRGEGIQAELLVRASTAPPPSGG